MEWIKVEKVLPMDLRSVLVCTYDESMEFQRCEVAYLDTYSGETDDEKDRYRGWFNNEEQRLKDLKITHWMPLPDSPSF